MSGSKRQKSLLVGLIQPILTEIRQKKFNDKTINNFKKDIIRNLEKLSQTNDLRIFDNKEGGILRGPVKSRKKYEKGTELLCDPNFMEHGRGKKPSEVPYMKALFNARKIDRFDLIAYETPLMRKKTKKKNKEISGRSVSCDLLGLDRARNELCCIEVKTVPDTNTTFVPYALLEGFAYAVCLNWISENNFDELMKEVEFCCNSFGIKPLLEKPSKISFAIAAPYDDYFQPYVNQKFEYFTEKWLARRLYEINILENALKGTFSEYIVLLQGTNKVTRKTIGKFVKPQIPLPVKVKQTTNQFNQIT